MFLSFWKLGKRRAVVVFWGLDLGREEAVRRMFVKGYIECDAAFANDTFDPVDEITRLAFLLRNIAGPVLLSGTNNNVLSVCSHCV